MENYNTTHEKNLVKIIQEFAKKSLNIELDNNLDNTELLEKELNNIAKQISKTKRILAQKTPEKKIEDNYNLQLLDSSPDGIVAINEQKQIVVFNKQAEKLFGYSKEEIMGALIDILMPETKKKQHNDYINDYFSNLSPRTMGSSGRLFYAVKKNGETFPADISLNYVDTPNGIIAISAIRDLTDKQNLYAKLKESEQKLHEITSIIPAILYQSEVSEAGEIKFTFISDAAKKIVGLNPDDIYNNSNNLFYAVHPEDIEETKKAIAESNITGSKFEHTFRVIKKDGSIIWMHAEGISVKQADGKYIRNGYFIDITPAKNAELEIIDSKQKYKNILESTDEMINTVSLTGEILWANSAWKRNLNYNDNELIGLKIVNVFTDDTKVGFEERLQILRAGNSIRNNSANMITKNGEIINVKGTIVPYFENGKLAGTQGFFRNVTEIKKERRERLKAEIKLLRTLDNMVTACVIFDYNWQYLYINEAAAKIAFQTKETFLGKNLQDINPNIEESIGFKKFKKCMEERVPLQFVEKHTFSNGISKYLEFKVEPTEEGIFVMANDITEKKKTEEINIKYQELLNESQRLAKIGSWELDLLNNILTWSEEVYRIFEIDPLKFGASYEAFLNLVHPDDREFVDNAYTKSVINKTGYNIIHRLKFNDGRIKYLKEQSETFYNSKGEPIRSIGTVQDITKEKEAELLISKNEQKYQQLVENIHDGLISDDNNGKVTFANKRFLEMFGFSYSDLETLTPNDIIAPEYKETLLKQHANRFAGKQVPSYYTFLGIKKTGERRWFEVHCNSIFDGNNIVGSQSIVRDITIKIDAEQQIKDTTYRYKTLLDSTDEMINTFSLEGKILWANNAWKNNLLFDCNDIKELFFLDLFTDESKENLGTTISNLFSGLEIQNITISVFTKNKNIIDISGTIVPYFEGGKLTGTQGFFRNVTEIKKERRERIKAETKLQRTLDNMVTGCMVLDFNWVYKYVNKAAAEQAFQKPENLIGKTMLEMYSDVEKTNVFLSYKKCMDERIPLEFEEKYVFSNGEIKWFDFKVDPVEEGIFVITMDITERKIVEEKIKKNQLLLNEAQRIANIGTWDLDIKNDTLYWSDELYKIFELPPNTDINTNLFLSYVHTNDIEELLKTFEHCIKNKTILDVTFRIKLLDNKIKYLHDRAEIIFNEQNEPIRVVGTIQDITKEKQAELLLQQNEHKYQEVIENINDGLMIINLNAHIIFTNNKFLEMFRLEKSDLKNLHIDDIISPEYREILSELRKKRFAGEKVADFFEYIGLRKDGTKCWFEVRVTNIYENNTIIGSQSIIRDINIRKEAEQKLESQNFELKKINSELDSFVYSTSHDLRSPLMSLMGLIDLCVTIEGVPADLHQYFSMMKNCTYRVDDTIKEILVYSHNSRKYIGSEKININQILTAKLENIKTINTNKKIELYININEEVDSYSDKQRVAAIINCLIANAYTYYRDNETSPYIKFNFSATEKEGIIIVEDNGEGIEQNKIDKIFEMFYRNSEKSVGSGLGLYNCKEIVNKLGGTINITSELGKGSTFAVCIPNCK